MNLLLDCNVLVPYLFMETFMDVINTQKNSNNWYRNSNNGYQNRKQNLPKGFPFLCCFYYSLIVRAFIAVKVTMSDMKQIKEDGITEETVFPILSCFGDVRPFVNFGTIHSSSI